MNPGIKILVASVLVVLSGCEQSAGLVLSLDSEVVAKKSALVCGCLSEDRLIALRDSLRISDSVEEAIKAESVLQLSQVYSREFFHQGACEDPGSGFRFSKAEADPAVSIGVARYGGDIFAAEPCGHCFPDHRQSIATPANHEASSHAVFREDGEIIQSCSFDTIVRQEFVRLAIESGVISSYVKGIRVDAQSGDVIAPIGLESVNSDAYRIMLAALLLASDRQDEEEVARMWLAIFSVLQMLPQTAPDFYQALAETVSFFKDASVVMPALASPAFRYSPVNVFLGTGQADSIHVGLQASVVLGLDGHDLMYGSYGHDAIYGNAGDDALHGDLGNDILYGGSGNDLIVGGAGDDVLAGQQGCDRYKFESGSGRDTILLVDQEESDSIAFFEGADMNSLWFSRADDSLVITRIGTTDQVTVHDWYEGHTRKLGRVEIPGAVLLPPQVEQLVSAMAAYDVPLGAGNVIPQETRDELQAVLASSWQPQ